LLSKMWRRVVNPLGVVAEEPLLLKEQLELRADGSPLLKQAMIALDIIDVKTQSLLSYISISFAALVFLLTSLAQRGGLAVVVPRRFATTLLLLIIVLLLITIVLCLSCLNIIRARTAHQLNQRYEQDPAEYECLVLEITCGRRSRYIIAQRISVMTALLTTMLFIDLLLASIATSP
jgi:hypothetical protein